MKKMFVILACIFISLQVCGQNISSKNVSAIHQYFVKHALFSPELTKIAHDSIFSIVFTQKKKISVKEYFVAMKKASRISLSPNMIQMLEAVSQTSTEKTKELTVPVPNTYGSVWISMPTISTEENSKMLKILKKYRKQNFINNKELEKIINGLMNRYILHISILFDVIIDKLDKEK